MWPQLLVVVKPSSKRSGYPLIITFTMCTVGTAKIFPSACIEDLMQEAGIKSGWKDICVHIHKPFDYYYYTLSLSLSLSHTHTHTHTLSLSADTKPSEKLTPLLTNANLTKDIGRLCPSYQTSSLESYHSVLNHFTPKSTGFSYLGMECR